MKQEEKNRLMRAKIIDAALHEFGEKSYAEASVNTICDEYHISKGILYHYYENKDDLYLVCVKACFEAIMEYLSQNLPNVGQGADRDLSAYFEVRQRFLAENPCYQGLFYQVSIAPPYHLKEAIAKARADFDRFNTNAFSAILEHTKLRPGITLQEVAEIHMSLQNALLGSEQMREATSHGLDAREALSRRWMDVLLHGVIAQS